MSNLSASLEAVLRTKKPHRMALQHYDVPAPKQAGQTSNLGAGFGPESGGIDSRFIEKCWLPLNMPVLNAQGEVQYIIHKVEDVISQ